MNLRKRPASTVAPSVPTLMSLSDQLETHEAAIQNLNQQIATMQQESSGSLKEVITQLNSLVESQGALAKLCQQQLGDKKNESMVKATPAKEKTFVLKHSLKNVSTFPEGGVSRGDYEHFYGADWRIRCTREDNNLGLFLDCAKHPQNESPMSVRHTARLVRVGKVVVEMSNELNYDRNDYVRIAGQDSFLTWRNVERAAVKDEICVEMEVTICHTTCRVPGETRNFDEDRMQYSDVVLIAGGEKFYVLKKFLASKSDYFKSMFFGRFVEATMDQIPLENIDPKDFLGFLEVLHGERYLNDSNVEGIAHLAQFHLASRVLNSCENFLLDRSTLPSKTRFRLAIKYELNKLIKKIVSEMESVDEIKSALQEVLPEDTRITERMIAMFEPRLFTCW